MTAIETLSAVHAGDRVAPILLARRSSPADVAAAAGAGQREELREASDAELLARFDSHLAELGHAVQPYEAVAGRRGHVRERSLRRAGDRRPAGDLSAVFAADRPGTWLDAEPAAQRLTDQREALVVPVAAAVMFGLFNCGGASTVRQGRAAGALACVTARSFSDACSRCNGNRRF